MAEQRLTIIVTTKSKRRALEIVNVLQPIVQTGESIQYSIEDTEPAKKAEKKEIRK